MSAHPTEQAKALFQQGLSLTQAGDWGRAEQLFAQALVLAPGRPSLMQNLGIARVVLKRHAEAEPLLRAALDPHAPASPETLGAWRALAQAQLALAQYQPALTSLERCFALGETGAIPRAQYAQCLSRLNRGAEAITAYQRALHADAQLPDAWTELGNEYRQVGRHEDAERCYREALARGGDADMLHYFLAAMQGDAHAITATPPHYVRQLFDQYAEQFDEHLVRQLGYRGHERLIDLLPPEAGTRFARVLDLGCGTGLCGAHLRATLLLRHDVLEGVDLSPAMLEKARARQVYDVLHLVDIHEFLATPPEQPFDLVLAADVFIYLGALDRVYAAMAQWLRPGGWLAFTVETPGAQATAAQGMELRSSMRYAHALGYLRALAARHGLTVMHMQEEVLRHDQRQAVAGAYVYLRRD
ncbi:methyltransferase [Hylemonella gracilis str. Niagara R]|uniref:Methyltransferase n=1 Tax=Hylemonella gracilis str. Niagara R TaxID=1458275 RepID=A0A016XDF8_9BURK|nr:tetratricopeptide repeat protein [Hylemonella gracilis]EYC50124.1 methyltransferase [Hylemonella gracilis str. Niagara R]